MAWDILRDIALVITALALCYFVFMAKGRLPTMGKDRRASQTFSADQEKFSTQRGVTYSLLAMFAATAAWVLHDNDQSERSMILQTVIGLAWLAIGYWFGASKQGQDQAQTMSRIAEAAPVAAKEATDKAINIALGTPTPIAPTPPADAPPVANMEVKADTVNVTETPKT